MRKFLEVREAEGDKPALRVGSTPDVVSSLNFEPAKVAFDVGSDSVVPRSLAFPTAGGGVLSERDDVGQLSLQRVGELRRRDVVVAPTLSPSLGRAAAPRSHRRARLARIRAYGRARPTRSVRDLLKPSPPLAVQRAASRCRSSQRAP